MIFSLLLRARTRWALWVMRQRGHVERKRDEDGEWLYSLTKEGKRWHKREEERRKEARVIAHELRQRPDLRPPSNSYGVAADQMLRGNWRPR